MRGDFLVSTLRHFAFRIWVTVFVGGILNLWVLPAFHGPVGLEWIILPASAILIAVFIAFGWLSNRIGFAIVDRLVRDATAWERVGLHKRAEEGFRKASALLDSFLLSPIARRRSSDRITGNLVRFYLARPEKNHASEALTTSYLLAHPEDADSAEIWLQQIESQGGLRDEHHELLLHIGENHPHNRDIQHMIARFYLSAGRTDFPALQTYRRALNGAGGAGDDIIEDLANLFLAEGRADEWALTVYIHAYRVSGGKSHLLQGIAACVYWAQETKRTGILIKEAQGFLKDFDETTLDLMRTGFNPPSLQPFEKKISRTFRAGAMIRRLTKWIGKWFIGLIKTAIPHARSLGLNLRILIRSSTRLRYALKWAPMAILVIGVSVLMVNTVRHLVTKEALTDDNTTATVLVTDPFTLQVAAYVRLQDAERYVEYLKKSGIDAFCIKTMGKSKTWYQVRVSHFPTKESARDYGKALKSRGIIDDFYVANYEKP